MVVDAGSYGGLKQIGLVMMLRAPLSVLLSLFIRALTLSLALDPSHPDESTTPVLQVQTKLNQSNNLHFQYSLSESSRLGCVEGDINEAEVESGGS